MRFKVLSITRFITIIRKWTEWRCQPIFMHEIKCMLIKWKTHEMCPSFRVCVFLCVSNYSYELRGNWTWSMYCALNVWMNEMRVKSQWHKYTDYTLNACIHLWWKPLPLDTCSCCVAPVFLNSTLTTRQLSTQFILRCIHIHTHARSRSPHSTQWKCAQHKASPMLEFHFFAQRNVHSVCCGCACTSVYAIPFFIHHQPTDEYISMVHFGWMLVVFEPLFVIHVNWKMRIRIE